MNRVRNKSEVSMLVALLGLGMASCGNKETSADDTKSTVSASALAADASLSAGAINAQYSDLMSASTDQSASGSTLAVSLQDELQLAGSDKSIFTRACNESGSTAVVTIAGSIDKSNSRTSANGKVSIEHSVTGSSSVTRTWSRADGTAVKCGSGKEFARLDWESPSGLSLVQVFSRERNQTLKIEGPKRSKDASSSFKASGTRTVTWASNSSSSDTTTTFVRNKSVQSSAVRESTIKDKNGSQVSLKLTIKTKESAPLVMQIERLKTDQSVISRTISSGTLVSTKDESDGSIEMSFSNLKVSMSSGECKLASGSATATFLDSAGATLKVYTLSVDSSGEPQLLDSTGTAVEDFELDACDPEDLKN